MQPEADAILNVFRDKGMRAGSMLHPTDFGDAIVWQGGSVRDEPVRVALQQLFADGHLIELNNAFELGAAGDAYLYGDG